MCRGARVSRESRDGRYIRHEMKLLNTAAAAILYSHTPHVGHRHLPSNVGSLLLLYPPVPIICFPFIFGGGLHSSSTKGALPQTSTIKDKIQQQQVINSLLWHWMASTTVRSSHYEWLCLGFEPRRPPPTFTDPSLHAFMFILLSWHVQCAVNRFAPAIFSG